MKHLKIYNNYNGIHKYQNNIVSDLNTVAFFVTHNLIFMLQQFANSLEILWTAGKYTLYANTYDAFQRMALFTWCCFEMTVIRLSGLMKWLPFALNVNVKWFTA